MDKKYINWNSIEFYSINVALQIKASLPYLRNNSHCIVALSKGGLIPARLIARELDTREIFCLGLSSYTEDNKRENSVEVYQPLNVESVATRINSYQDVIFVDDIVDTGQTYRYVRQYWDSIESDILKTAERRVNLYTSALIYKPANQEVHSPDFFGVLMEGDEWVVFPWENKK